MLIEARQPVAEGEKPVDSPPIVALVLMCDHTYCFRRWSPVARPRGGAIGEVQFDSVRINLGIIQSDVSIWWDLAPTTCRPGLPCCHPKRRRRGCAGADPVGAGQISRRY